jgi:hypothetical protein
MKSFVMLFVVVTISPAAMAWEKVFSCASDSTVIEKSDMGTEYRLLIRQSQNLGAADAFLYGRVDGSGEATVPLRKNRDNNAEFIGQDDAYRNDGRVYYVKPRGNQLAVEVFRTSQPSGGTFANAGQIAIWNFSDCR